MPRTVRTLLAPSTRGRSREVASFFAQLDDLSRRMFADLADCRPAELAWQPARGRNTIGMLLAHCALVEASWLLVASENPPADVHRARLERAMGIDADADGVPLPPDGRAPGALRRWTLARHRRLHDRARRFAKRAASRFRDADLDREIRRVRRDGTVRILNPRWALYHVLEHLAGHYGQMLLLRHEYRDRRRR